MKFYTKRFLFFSQLLARPLASHGVFFVVMFILVSITTWVVGRPGREFGFYAAQLFGDLYAIATILTILPKRFSGITKTILYVLAYTLAVVECFLFLRFRLTYSPAMLNLLTETNGGEAMEFMSICLKSKEFWKSLSLFIPLLFIHSLWSFFKRRFFLFSTMNTTTWKVTSILLPSFLFIFWGGIYGRIWWIEKQKIWSFFNNSNTRKAEQYPENIFFTSAYRLFHAGHYLSMAHNEMESLIQKMKTLQVDSCKATCPNIVVIIGESYNKHHAQIYGYSKATTPNLLRWQCDGSLQVFTNVVSPWNLTSNSFKSFLSTHSSGEPGNWMNGVLFPAIFRKAGYKVAFITNQFYRSAAQGSIDFNGSFFLNDERMSQLCFDYRNRFRSKTELQITKLLKGFKPQSHNLYLLHLYGQHMEYHRRYPKECTFFTPDSIQRPNLNLSQKAIVAHYDNATRYNDEVIANIFNYFRNEDALILYFSDHGEEVYDNHIRIYGRNHTPTPNAEVLRNEYEIPFMIWSTPMFRKQHSEIIRRIKKAIHLPFSHDDLPHLLMGLAGIHTSYYNPQRDLLSSDFKPQRRWIKDSVDYDSIRFSKKIP